MGFKPKWKEERKKNGDSTRVEKHAKAKGVPLVIIHESVKTEVIVTGPLAHQ